MMLRTQAVVPDGHGRLATSPTAVFDTGEESIAIKSLIILPQELLDLEGEAAHDFVTIATSQEVAQPV